MSGVSGAALPIRDHDPTRGSAPLDGVLTAIASAVSEVDSLLRAGARDSARTAAPGSRNAFGDEQVAEDLEADEIFARHLAGASVREIFSEESHRVLATGARGEAYRVVLYPLDGSSNVEVDETVGSIFGVYPATGPWPAPGTSQIAAGYALYGLRTLLVIATGDEYYELALDLTERCYTLTATSPPAALRSEGAVYSVNESRSSGWSDATREVVRRLGHGRSLRYAGCLVADFHRILHKGGIFAYPSNREHPDGKLRLLYEAAPLALIARRAGGGATTGCEEILAVRPRTVDDLVPLYIGGAREIGIVSEMLGGRSS